MKKLIAIILTLTLALTLAACDIGGSGNTGGNSNQGGNNNSGSGNNQGGGNGTGGEATVAPVLPNLPSIDENPVSDFEYKAIAGGVEITKYIGTSIRVRIPEKIEGVTVTSIGDLAFFQTGIMEVIIPNGVSKIGRSAFSGNEALTSITMGNDKISTGSLIHFGGIFWRVLEIQDGRALIITEDIIEHKAYHSPGGEITWEHSTIRQYLNGDFYNSFSTADQSRIKETNVINNDNPNYGTAGGNNTTDNIFLLSIDEAQTYFADNSARIAVNTNGEASWWWLRSPGGNSYFAAYVGTDGGIVGNGSLVGYGSGVRPALWLNL